MHKYSVMLGFKKRFIILNFILLFVKDYFQNYNALLMKNKKECSVMILMISFCSYVSIQLIIFIIIFYSNYLPFNNFV